MGGPWEEYQTTTESGPWDEYSDDTGKPKDSLVGQGIKQESDSFISNVNEKLSKRGANITEEWSKPDLIPGERLLRTTGQVAGGINDIIGEGLKSGYKTFVPESVQKSISGGLGKMMQSDVVQSAVPTIKTLADAYAVAKQKYPDVIKDVEAAGNIAAFIPIGWGASKTKPVIEGGMDILKGETATAIEGTLSDTIKTGINKSIRPSVSGKGTYTQAQAYYNKAEDAVKEIVKNKSNLQYVDDSGETIVGQLPKTLDQFSHAVDQTKKNIFTQYDEMARAAGQKGAEVDLSPIVSELEKVASDRVVQNESKRAAAYALQKAEDYKNVGSYTAEEAQRAIATLNNSLKAFYKNPTFENASIASIDAMVANNMRKSLDDVIEGAVDSGYQALKKQYGALKTIEGDVNRRAVVDARKNARGLIDFSDIFSGSTAVHAILTMNPALAGKAGAMYAIKEIIKHRTNPNTVVKNMFSKTERLLNKKARY